MCRGQAVIVDYINIIKVLKNPKHSARTTGYYKKQMKKFIIIIII